MSGKTRVRFSASGYGSSVQVYPSREVADEEVGREAEEMAADHGLEPDAVTRFVGEWVLESPSGEEIARWEII